MRKILVVEDEDLIREMYEIVLADQPYEVDLARDGQQALEYCKTTEYDLILLDLMMPVMDGPSFMQKFMPKAPPKTKVLILSNLSSGHQLDAAMLLGAHRSAIKSDISPQQLVTMIRHELEAV